MIQKYVDSVSGEMGIKTTAVSIIEGRAVGCLDAYLLHIASEGQLVSALVYQSELDYLEKGICCDRLELRINSALSRLKMLLERNT